MDIFAKTKFQGQRSCFVVSLTVVAQIGPIEECRNLLKKIVCFQEVKAVNILTAPLSCNILEPKPCRMLCSTDPIEGQDLPPMLWPQFIFITFYYFFFEGLYPFH